MNCCVRDLISHEWPSNNFAIFYKVKVILNVHKYCVACTPSRSYHISASFRCIYVTVILYVYQT